MRSTCCLVLVALLALIVSPATAERPPLEVVPQPASDDAQPPSAPVAEPETRPAPKTFTVEPKRLKIEIDLKGVFEAARMTPVSLETKVWSSLVVERAVPPGTVVKKGDQLLWLRMRDIDQQLADIEASSALTALAMKQAKESLRFAEAASPDAMTWAQRSKRIADEEYQDFLDLVLPYEDRYYVLDGRGLALRLEAAEEEVKQLRQMYKADELVDDTEAIVLKRNEHFLDRTRIDSEVSEERHARSKDQDFLRRRETEAKKHKDAEIAWDQAQTILPMQMEEKRLNLEKMLYDQAKADRKLVELKADREMMVVRAPADGIVYYGKCLRGAWPTAGQMDSKLRRGGQIGSMEVFMTLVQPEGILIRAEAGENDLHNLKVDQTAKITPTGFPAHKLQGKVTDVIILPPGPGQFTVKIAIDGDVGPVMPGMTCELKLVGYDKADALLAPAKAVFHEDDDEDLRYVYVQRGDEAVKQSVTVGRSKGDDVEIVEGLAAGDVILLEKPDEPK